MVSPKRCKSVDSGDRCELEPGHDGPHFMKRSIWEWRRWHDSKEA